MTLLEFARQMEVELENNSYKSGWQGMSPGQLLRRLSQEVEELRRELRKKKLDSNAIVSECADVANFAMMIAENAGEIAEEAEYDRQQAEEDSDPLKQEVPV